MSQPARAGEPTVQPCLLCGAPDALLRCGACGAAFTLAADGVLRGAEPTLGVSYPDEGNDLTLQVEDASFWFHHRNKVLELMLERFKPGGTLWDIGGGNGFQALHFQEQGRAVVMVEPGPGG